MEASNKVFALLKGEDPSQILIGVFSSCESAKKEIENIEEKNDQLFYIQERYLDSIKFPNYEIEIRHSSDGRISEMTVTRN